MPNLWQHTRNQTSFVSEMVVVFFVFVLFEVFKKFFVGFFVIQQQVVMFFFRLLTFSVWTFPDFD